MDRWRKEGRNEREEGKRVRGRKERESEREGGKRE